MTPIESAAREIIEQLLRNEITEEKALNAAKKAVSIRYKLSSLLGNSQIFAAARNDEEKQHVLSSAVKTCSYDLRRRCHSCHDLSGPLSPRALHSLPRRY